MTAGFSKRGWWIAILVVSGVAVLLVVALLWAGNKGLPGQTARSADTVINVLGMILALIWFALVIASAARGKLDWRAFAPPRTMQMQFGTKWSGVPDEGFPFAINYAEDAGEAGSSDAQNDAPTGGETELALRAEKLLAAWKGDSYVFGSGVLGETGALAARFGRKAVLVANQSDWLADALSWLKESLGEAGIQVVAECAGARPNTPKEDVYRIQATIESAKPALIVTVGAGSTIDAVKAAAALAAVSPGSHDVDALFGSGKVTAKLTGKRITPIVAVETAASSASHLTKYSNVTDMAAGQKKLIIDDSLTPPAAVFDYALTVSSPRSLTVDGALDGLSHSIEVYYGAKGPAFDKVEEIALTGVELILSSVRAAVSIPYNLDARRRLGLGTDLGGYSIMLGSTSGGHLTSFSLVDVAAHGRATAIMNPFYTVLFAPAIQRHLLRLGELYSKAGYLKSPFETLSGRDLALAVAEAMMALASDLGAGTSLGILRGFSAAHIERALAAAKDPSLESKLRAMPVPMDATMIDEYMRPVLEAAAEGDLRKVKTIAI